MADLADNQPDIIFVSDTIGEDTLTANENYSDLKAVKDGKITVLKNKYFERPSGRITELIGTAAKAFGVDPSDKAEPENSSVSAAESENSSDTINNSENNPQATE